MMRWSGATCTITVEVASPAHGRASWHSTKPDRLHAISAYEWLPGYKVLKLIKQKFLIADYAFHQISNRDYSDEFCIFDDREMANSFVGHDRHAIFDRLIRLRVENLSLHDFLDARCKRGAAF